MLDSPEGSQRAEQDGITLAQAYAKGWSLMREQVRTQ